MPKNWKGDPLGFFIIHSVAKHQKIEGEKFYFRKKISVPKKTERGGPFGEKNFPKKKSRSAKQIERGDHLVSPGMVCYAGKQGKPFLVQFARPDGAIW